jgi:predicted  nucleic acid-binding Zn-ribbon protein
MTIEEVNLQLRAKKTAAKPQALTVAATRIDVTQLKARIADARKQVAEMFTMAGKLNASKLLPNIRTLSTRLCQMEYDLAVIAKRFSTR